jgi:hypothetical protein
MIDDNERLGCLKNKSDVSKLRERDVCIEKKIAAPRGVGVNIHPSCSVNSDPAAFSDSIGITGKLAITIIRKDGTREEFQEIENLITQSGFNLISDLLSGVVDTPITTMWIGTGGRLDENTVKSPLTTNTRLYEYYGSRPVTSYRDTVEGDTLRGFQAISRYAATFDFTEEVHINEAALATGLSNSDDVVMLNHRTFYDRVMYSEDFLELTWDIIFSRFLTKPR